MNLKVLIAAFVMFLMGLSAGAQNKKTDEEKDEYDENYEFKDTKTIDVNLGIGFGLDYGGLGGKLMILPSKHVGFFGGIGYNLDGLGYNVGGLVRFLPDGRVSPYGSLMYGYNGVIVVDGAEQYNKTYYGVSLGTGIELKTRNGKFWNFELVVPFRNKEFYDAVDALQNNPDIEMSSPLPITISVGYHFKL